MYNYYKIGGINMMKKSVVALITTLVLGYLGIMIGIECFDFYFPEFGIIIAIAVRGMFIMISRDKSYSSKSNRFVFGLCLMFSGMVSSSIIISSTMYTPHIYSSVRYLQGWLSCLVESKLIFPLIFFVIISMIGLFISIKEIIDN